MDDIPQALFDSAIHIMLLADGDRDHMNTSHLTVEQSMDICRLLRACRHKLYPDADPA